MLFVLAIEGLKALFENAVNVGLLDSIHIDGYANPIFILQFADDTLLFLPNNLVMVRNLLRILCCLELVSDLQINYEKSSVIGINVDDNSLSDAAGFPLSLKPVKAPSWDPVISNFLQQLAGWKGNLLSPAGRLVLVKSVLSSLPVYFLCSFYIP
ncbi:uncharacterized protein LOC126673867 [Mercurialis annua]|uniref:uncharacterized protein LOC126673867 n=1 Tax=Mercurialis annua TaxID=3986 RepID=UPI00215FF401|nr:uncharacterized protein LOC126673867 [Mercurialis annua]